MNENSYPGIDQRAVRAVTQKSKKLITRYGLSKAELPDLQQNWLIRILHSKEYQNREDPQFSHHLNRMVKDCYIDEIRRRNAQKRRCETQSISLEAYFGAQAKSETDCSADEVISEESYFAFTGVTPIGPGKAAEVKIDAEDFMASLPEELRELATRLMKLSTIEAVSQSSASRATAFRRLKQLRAHAQKFFSGS
ncbi:MAG: hypothetical protein JW739_08130 [Opitutales bacterium]|nr:hypothetical protein [Opitutales bacterium]